MKYLIISTVYEAPGRILSVRSINVDKGQFQQFKDLFDDSYHTIRVVNGKDITILNIFIFIDL